MPHADDSVARKLTAQEREQMIERSVVPERDAVAPCLLVEHASGRVFRHEPRCGVEAFGLAVDGRLERIATEAEQREFETRRARVDDGDRIHRVSSRPLHMAGQAFIPRSTHSSRRPISRQGADEVCHGRS